MRVLITGGKGQLGQALFRVLSSASYRIYAPDRSVLDVTKIPEIEQNVQRFEPDLIIHSAANTDVDWCELNPAPAFRVNTGGTYNMARAAQIFGSVFVYISTNFVFNGVHTRPYFEEEKPLPVNIYGLSKLLGEELVAALLNRYFIIRTSWLYGGKGNFVEQILKLLQAGEKVFVVGDQFSAPTFVDDLARALSILIHSKQYGIYHLTNRGFCSRLEWVKKLLLYGGFKTELTEVDSAYFPNPAQRPHFAVLGNRRFKDYFGLELRGWQEGLSFYLKEYSPLGRKKEPGR